MAQLYLNFPPAAEEPPKVLKGFRKIMVGVNQTVVVVLTLEEKDLQSWSVVRGGWEVVDGTYDVFVGPSSRDIRLTGSILVP